MDPPQRFMYAVVSLRPQSHDLRVLVLLVAETLLLGSMSILCWLMLVLLVNVVYIPLVEERSLRKTFSGKAYLRYKENFPAGCHVLGRGSRNNATRVRP